MIKEIPCDSITDIADEFDSLFDPDDNSKVPQWECTDYVGLRKNPNAVKLTEYRWLAKLSQLRHMYPKTWRSIYQHRDRRKNVNICGFEPERSCEDIVTIIKDIVTKATIWGLSTCNIGSRPPMLPSPQCIGLLTNKSHESRVADCHWIDGGRIALDSEASKTPPPLGPSRFSHPCHWGDPGRPFLGKPFRSTETIMGDPP